MPVADWPLAQLRLKDDARFHWLLLVPRRADIVELTDLDEADYGQLTAEILSATRLVQEVARPDKTNVATLGNLVPQLHVHVIARFRQRSGVARSRLVPRWRPALPAPHIGGACRTLRQGRQGPLSDAVGLEQQESRVSDASICRDIWILSKVILN